jgi:hypothetical protein
MTRKIAALALNVALMVLVWSAIGVWLVARPFSAPEPVGAGSMASATQHEASEASTADPVRDELLGNAIVRDCFDVDTRNCLTANPRLHPALELLRTTSKGPGLLETAARAGVTIRLGPVPSDTMAFFRPSARAVTLSTTLASQSVRGQAAVLAHELRHVSDWAGIGRFAQSNSLSCYGGEASAFMTEIAVWHEVQGARPPIDALEIKEDDIATAMDTEGIGFWLHVGQLYHDQC